MINQKHNGLNTSPLYNDVFLVPNYRAWCASTGRFLFVKPVVVKYRSPRRLVVNC